jgi:hypothetical protein
MLDNSEPTVTNTDGFFWRPCLISRVRVGVRAYHISIQLRPFSCDMNALEWAIRSFPVAPGHMSILKQVSSPEVLFSSKLCRETKLVTFDGVPNKTTLFSILNIATPK